MTGRLAEGAAPAAPAAIALEASPYPYAAWRAVAHATSSPDGSFAIAAPAPESNEHVRVTAAGAASDTLSVTVDPRAALHSSSLGPGRVRLSLRLAHGKGLASPPVTARWYLAVRGSDTFHLAATSRTHELPGSVTYAAAIVDPPARRFLWRVCVNPRWEAAMGPPSAHGACPAGGFHLPHAHRASPRARAAFEFAAQGRGTPLPPFPTAAGIAAARSFLAARAGRTSFAVLDSAGRLSGLNTREHFQTASVVKVMFLTAYLQRLDALHRTLGAADRSLLYPMIHESNNDSASAVLGVVGGAAVARVAREAGMQDYAPGVGWWAFTQTSAADQARFFAQLGRLIPARFYGYARYLMSTIEPEQSWGIPPVARPRWQVYFKTGALPSEGLYHEVALLERGAQHFTVAVFTDGDPSKAYGEETIAGVGARLLVGSP
ncbi:MAG TPA: serine hydrolase [Solirubrobacteraceae bacterium]|nr:serine hydrolase [Solirubrobacteraceae bacterium]